MSRVPSGRACDLDTPGRDVLGEVARADVEPLGAHRLDALLGEEADLTVPRARVAVAGDAVADTETDL